MWALRLTEEEKDMLQECADSSKSSLTDMVRWLIRQYHQEHVERPRVVPASDKAAPAPKRGARRA